MTKGEIRIINLDFTPDFVFIVSESTGRKMSGYYGATSNNLSTENVTYVPNMYGYVVNGDNYGLSFSSCYYITIIENGIKITDFGYGTTNVFYIAIKCKN